MAQQLYDRKAEDLGNLVGLEHVNLRIDNQGLASEFYLSALGLTRDPFMFPGTNNMWVNVGKQPVPSADRRAERAARPCRPGRPRSKSCASGSASVKKKLDGHQVRLQAAQRLCRGDLPVGQQVPPLRAGRGAVRRDHSRHALCRVRRAGGHRRRHRALLPRDLLAPAESRRTARAAPRTSAVGPSRSWSSARPTRDAGLRRPPPRRSMPRNSPARMTSSKSAG